MLRPAGAAPACDSCVAHDRRDGNLSLSSGSTAGGHGIDSRLARAASGHAPARDDPARRSAVSPARSVEVLGADPALHRAHDRRVLRERAAAWTTTAGTAAGRTRAPHGNARAELSAAARARR